MPSTIHPFEPKVGVLVNVQSRTWPGINKPGGVGRVTEITYQDSAMFIDIDYVLGGKEKSIEMEFVEEHKFDEDNNGRAGRGRSSRRARVAPQEEKTQEKTTSTKAKKGKETQKKTAFKDASSKVNKKRSSPTVDSKAKSKKQKVPLKARQEVIQRHKEKKTKDGTKKKRGEVGSERVEIKGPNRPKAGVSKLKREPQPPPSPSTKKGVKGFLKGVYKEMSTKATTFVQDIIGMSGSEPSSPASTSSSLELNVENKRVSEFRSMFSSIMRVKMAESIEMNDLLSELNKRCGANELFSELELRSHLQTLDKDDKVMITWDTGTIYML